MRIRRFLPILLIGAALTGLVACGKEPEPEVIVEEVPTPTPTPEIVKTKVTYSYFDDSMEEWLKKCEEKYEAEHEDIDIILKKGNPDNLSERTADAFLVDSMEMGECIADGLATPIDSYMSKAGIRRDDYKETVLNMFIKGSDLYALPESYDTVGLWYNKTIFDASGVSYPNADTGWMNVVDILGSLTNEAGGVYGMAVDYDNLTPVMVTIAEMGGAIYDEEGNIADFDNSLTKAGIRCFVDLIDAGYIPSVASMNEKNAIRKLMDGEAAMIYGWASDYLTVKASENAGNYNCTYLPTLSGNRVTPMVGRANCISEASNCKKEAFEWIAFLTKDSEAMKGFTEICHGIPAYNQTEQALLGSIGEANNLFIFAEEAGDNSYILPIVPDIKEKQTFISEELLSAFELKNSVDEACIEICSKFN